MQHSLRNSLIESLFEEYIDLKDGEVPWDVVYLYLNRNPDKILYSFSSKVMYRTLRYISEHKFLTETYLGDMCIYSSTSECPYIANEHFCVNLELAKKKYEYVNSTKPITST